MYLNYFGLDEQPFALTPDPRFFYLSEHHREGLAHLLYGTDDSGSFVLLTGEVGTGKTMLCRTLMEQAPETVDFALILNPLQTPLELLASICDEFKVVYPKGTSSRKNLIDRLNVFLLKAHGEGKRTVVVIDEAQNLGFETLEQVRLLTNLETGSHKLLKIILVGQPELKAILARPELRQISQRVTARFHLETLSRIETSAYVKHRMKIAGGGAQIFTSGALASIYKYARGTPRVINVICERALLGAYAGDLESVDRKTVKRAVREVLSHRQAGGWRWGVALATVLLAALAAGWYVVDRQPAVQARVAQSEVESVPLMPMEQKIEVMSEEPAEAILEKTPEPKTDPLHEWFISAPDEPTAMARLFSLWDADFTVLPGDSACERALATGLRCLYDNGTLADIRRYNRPAILELFDDSGVRRHLLVVAIEDNRPVVELAGARHVVTMEQIESWWTGDYLLLWRSTPGGLAVLKPGKTGPDAAWLEARLNRAAGVRVDESALPDRYDAALTDRVTAFQREHGLLADGVAGVQTLITLATAISDSSTPMLIHGGE